MCLPRASAVALRPKGSRILPDFLLARYTIVDYAVSKTLSVPPNDYESQIAAKAQKNMRRRVEGRAKKNWFSEV